MPAKQYQAKTYKTKNRLKTIIKKLGLLVLFSILLITLFCLGVFIYYAKDLPRPEVFSERQQILPTRIYDRTGETLLRTIYQEEKRRPVELEKVPEHLIQAVMATEDTNFFQHKGVDFKGIVRAVLIDLQLRKPVHGASTISQQLIRSTYLTLEKTVQRKIREVVLTLELERRYSKEQILEWYLNQIPLGPNIYGVGEASQSYFNKPVSELSLEESAVLAALIKAPSFYYPFGENQDQLMQRKDYVLERMVQVGFISQEQAQEAKQKEIAFKEPELSLTIAPHFVLYVENYLYQKYGADYLSKQGLKVYTTLNLDLQQKAEEIVRKGAETNTKYYNSHNASLVAITPYNGEIVAMVGSKDFFGSPEPENCTPGTNCQFEPRVNVAVYGEGQQPGSAFKPFVYATAFKQGYTPNSIVVDEKTNFGRWGDKDYIPENYDGRYRGPVTFRQALAQSLNIPSIKILLKVGIENAIETAHDMGITTLNQEPSFYGPSLVLGAGEVKLLDMVASYSVFANKGLKVPATPILRIEDKEGKIIETGKKTPKRVLSQEVAETLNDVLSDNKARAPMFGSRSELYFPGYKVAAKTGTTDGFRDAWAIGYTEKIAAGVWTGNNDNSSTAEKPGLVIAGPIWHQFMEYALSYFSDFQEKN